MRPLSQSRFAAPIWRRATYLLPGAAVFAFVAILMAAGALRTIDNDLLDARFSLLDRGASGNVVVVAIDGASLARLPTWPWPRSYYGQVLDALAAAGARRVVFDIDFSSASRAAEDAALEAALARHGAITFLPVFEQIQHNTLDPNAMSVSRPLPRFARHVQLTSINVKPAADGLIRTYPRFSVIGGTPFPSAGFVLSGATAGTAGSFIVDYAIDPASVPQIPFHEVLGGRFSQTMVAGTTVIVGATAVELGDRLAVPVWRNIAGPVLNVLAAESLASGKPLRRLGSVPTTVVVLLIALIMTPRFAAWSWGRGATVVTGTVTGALAGSLAVQASASVILPLAAPLAAVVSGYAVGLVTRINRQAISLVIESLTAQHRRALLDRVVRQSNDGIVILTSSGAVEQANPAARRILRQTATSALPALETLLGATTDSGSQLLRCLTVGDPTAAKLGLQEVILRGTSDDDAVHIEIVVSEVRVDPGAEAAAADYTLICVLRDVTERKRIEAMRRKIIEDSLRVAEAKSSFFANMNHELRTPLNHIIGFAEMLQGNFLGELNDKQNEYVGNIVDSGQELLQLITEILEYANTEDGEAKLHETDVDLGALMAEIADIATHRVAGRLIAVINLANQHDLPRIRADQRMLRQALLNILANSIKFNTEPGHIVLDAAAGAAGISIIVTDDGSGMTPRQITDALEPFTRGEEAFNRSHDGHGLGLPLSKSLVEAHGGTLSIASVPDQGTSVTIGLPARRVVRRPGREASAAPDLHRRAVLHAGE